MGASNPFGDGARFMSDRDMAEVLRQAEAELVLADYEKRCPLRNIVNAAGEIVGQIRVSDQMMKEWGCEQ